MTAMRDQLFDSIAAHQGATVLPGRYGGDEGTDKLAIIFSGVTTTLLLGLKILDASGGLQLSTSDAGNIQYSSTWLLEVVSELKTSPSTMPAAAKILESLESESLVVGVICLNPNTLQVSMHRLAIR